MKNHDESISIIQLQTLRKNIKEKYKQYHLTDRDRFPAIEYNTNRNNYEPLRASIEAELFTVRGIDKNADHFQVPSISTLANLFTKDSYLPGKKLLDTYQIYAELDGISESNQVGVVTYPARVRTTRKSLAPVAYRTAFIALIALLAFCAWRLSFESPSGLLIVRPTANSFVPEEMVIEGKVSNAETVWLVVRPKNEHYYYVQPQVKVQHDGKWLGVIYIGEHNSENDGLTFQIRALVNPVEKLINGEMYYDWPEAELTSKIVEVVRK